MPAKIRLATEADAPAIAAVYALYVLSTVISFELTPPTADEISQRMRRITARFPWLVCENPQGDVIGYAYASVHNERAAYQWSVDTAIYTDSRVHRSGVGRGLYTSLFALLRLQGFYNAYAGVTPPNPGSIGLHLALGFEPIGVYRKIGYKFGGWHDVNWYSLLLQPLSDAPTPPRLPAEAMTDPAWPDALNAGSSLIRL